MPKEVKPRQQEVPKVDDALYGIKTFAAKLGIPLSKAYTMCAANEVPAYRIGIRWMFRQAEVDKWLQTRRVGPQL
jgi:excisionase family DNA binding protein